MSDTTTTPVIKFQHNGLKVDGKLWTAYMWIHNYDRDPAGLHISLSVKSYRSLPSAAFRLLGATNNSDIQTDYFDNDHVVIKPTSPYWSDAARAVIKHLEMCVAQQERTLAKCKPKHKAAHEKRLADRRAELASGVALVAHGNAMMLDTLVVERV